MENSFSSSTPAADALEGELIVEDLFQDEKPSSAPRRSVDREGAEDAVIDAKPSPVQARGEPLQKRGLAGLFSKGSPAQSPPKEPTGASKGSQRAQGQPKGSKAGSTRRALVFWATCALVGFGLWAHGSFRSAPHTVPPPARPQHNPGAVQLPGSPRSVPVQPAVKPAAAPAMPPTSVLALPEAQSGRRTPPVAPEDLSSIDAAAVARLAQEAWIPGSRVEVSIAPSVAKLIVVLPLEKAYGGPSLGVSAPTPMDQVQQMLTLEAPRGCADAGILFSSDSPDIEHVFQCTGTVATSVHISPVSLREALGAALGTVMKSQAGALVKVLSAHPVGGGSPQSLGAYAQAIPGRSLFGIPLQITGTFADLAGLEAYLERLQTAPVLLTHLAISAKSFEVRIEVLGSRP